MRRGSLIQDVVKGTSLYTQLVGLLTDLENAYLELIGGQLWEGVGHPGLDQHASSFKVTGEYKNPPGKLRDGIPWEEWIRNICIHCGKPGHIRPQCPLYLEAVASGALKPPTYKPKKDDRHAPTKGSPKTSRNNFLKNPKGKALLSAFKSLLLDSDDSDEDDKAFTNEDTTVDDDENNDQASDDNDLQGFLSMLGSLKD